MTERLLDGYDALLLDLDGTVYRGGAAIDGAEPAVVSAHQAGTAVRFVTNNASRSPAAVSAHLRELGIPARPDEVTTSAQAAAGLLAQRLPAGALVLVVGTEALSTEVSGRGLRPVRQATPEVAAVVQGMSQDTGWRDLAEACLAIRAGALWVACNVDPTLPTERGQLPGNGALVAALRIATGVEPVIAGKPARPLMDDAWNAAAADRPLVVGDRLDTDIAGAAAVGADALLVLSGVSTAADLLAAPAEQRPRFLAADLHGVLRPPADVEITGQPGWTVERTDHGLRVRANGNGRPRQDGSQRDELALLRALCAVWWPTGGGPVSVDAADQTAADALTTLNLSRPKDRLA
ncbi:MAG TPA: HAD-IIA family hydrolase [Pseudonocardiaceae bacterium]|nr:HAD-IIA family hydrolase [Pseudonocardiaceae bacterium]